MMHKFSLVWPVMALSLFLTACEEDNKLPCGKADPIRELEWVEEFTALVDESCSSVQLSLFQAKYRRNTVYFLRVTDPRANVAFSVSLYNCEGLMIREFGSDDQEEFQKKVSQQEVIYRCESEL